jgi:pyridoxamine 5'-phosphate oxidase|tara:strand:- start:178 stop:807 length:630 start_codon:yes stop_codon:yes gene_type:complete
MNQKNGKNSIGLDSCFEEFNNPMDLFKKWFEKAKETEINDPNAVALGTSENNKSSVRMVLLKGLSNEGFVFYTNFNSKKGRDLNKNRFASMCFHWKSLRRQVRVFGEVKKVTEKEADEYYNSRAYGSRISAWASSQSEPMKSRDIFLNKIEEFKKKYPEEKNVPRPPNWSGWRIYPQEVEFWVDGEFRIHERLNYKLKNNQWIKEILYP